MVMEIQKGRSVGEESHNFACLGVGEQIFLRIEKQT
jgi:hypothetical protein